MKKYFLSPSLMCADLLNLEADLRVLETHHFDYLHIDIMDGHFVPNIALGFNLVHKINEMSRMRKDIHLMVDRPDLTLERLPTNKGDIVTLHVECKSDVGSAIKQIKHLGAKAGLAIAPNTPLEMLRPYLASIDVILMMTVHPGFAGQSFITASHGRIKQLAGILRENYPDIVMGIDGAVGFKEIETFGHMGVRHFVLGTSALFKDDLNAQAGLVTSFVETLRN